MKRAIRASQARCLHSDWQQLEVSDPVGGEDLQVGA